MKWGNWTLSVTVLTWNGPANDQFFLLILLTFDLIEAKHLKLGVTRSILNGHIFKNNVLTPIFYFSVHTGSRFPV